MQKTVHMMENGLVYIGYALGLVLLFENIIKIFSDAGQNVIGIKILLFSLILWAISYVSRKFVFGRNHSINNLSPFGKFKLEILYFLFCHTFTVLFISTMLRYTPVTFVKTQQELNNYQTYSGLLSYITKDFAFLLAVNAFLVFMFITFLLFASKFFYMFTLGKYKYFGGDIKKMSNLRVMTLALLIVFSLAAINTPFISGTVYTLHFQLNAFLKDNFQWLADYIFGSPIFYYVYASFKGSTLAEEFSAYRKFI
ncbi:hypothetical protein A2619_03135 [candidate division WWE3 bacterium RIFOXYD1_FULL_39_9]|uniref:Uncharacterized protein n=1 Tax=candidate division WWE3 bacterium RIFOXYD1_FULL_39_9 TaxID=1802649 RepID=A0A1F4X8M8_UNCKA|nr:MAG: hypothetical protein A2619_03135 [candidate division WWE3 bacterium RIFOXYD1_FULL_39_9]